MFCPGFALLTSSYVNRAVVCLPIFTVSVRCSLLYSRVLSPDGPRTTFGGRQSATGALTSVFAGVDKDLTEDGGGLWGTVESVLVEPRGVEPLTS
jgi:hypothetical protein